MALLNVVATATPTNAAAGNRQPAAILVSVSDATGGPVSGLAATNFSLDTLAVAPGGSKLVVSGFSTQAFGGYYRVEVVPIGTNTWTRGDFVPGVIVTRGTDKGQTLTSFRVP